MMPLLGQEASLPFCKKKLNSAGGGLFLCVSFVFRECPMFAVKFFFSSVFSEKSLDCYMLEKGYPYQVSPFFIYSTCKYNLPFERLPSKKL